MSQPANLNPVKQELIDFVFRTVAPKPHSFADLGGVWGVDGAYSFYALDTYRPESAHLVDDIISPETERRARAYDRLKLHRGYLGDAGMPGRLGRIGTVFLFDILLHQVRPDWNEMLEMYAAVTDCFAVYNPQYTASDRTVRLIDLGLEAYFENVPHTADEPNYRELVEDPMQQHPVHKRAWRDIHHVWQWGITEPDLCATMASLGFDLRFRKHHGRFGTLASFDNIGYVFQRG